MVPPTCPRRAIAPHSARPCPLSRPPFPSFSFLFPRVNSKSDPPLCYSSPRGLLVHIGGSLTHWEKANTQFANSVAFLTELATPLHPGLPAASRRSPDPTFRRRLISIDGRPGFRPSSPRFRQRQAGKQHGSVHEGPPGGNNGGKESGSRCPHQSFTSSGRELFPGSGLPHPTLQTPDRAPARASQARQGRRPVPTGRTKTFATSTPRQLPWSSSIFKLRAGTRLADPEPVERRADDPARELGRR